MSARAALIASGAVAAACVAAILACGTTHPLRATAVAAIGLVALSAFLMAWRREFGPGAQMPEPAPPVKPCPYAICHHNSELTR
jgi:hypothetical protein